MKLGYGVIQHQRSHRLTNRCFIAMLWIFQNIYAHSYTNILNIQFHNCEYFHFSKISYGIIQNSHSITYQIPLIDKVLFYRN